MARTRAEVQKLRELREGFHEELILREREVEALRNKIKGLDAGIATLEGVDIATDPRRRTRRNVKKSVMEIIADSAKAGVTAIEVVERAAAKGKQLDRGSVSSLLSRFKREGVLIFNGERYYPAAPPVLEVPAALKVVKS